MHYLRAALAALSMTVAVPCTAATLIDVGGANQAYTIGAGKAAAISFQLESARTNVAISAPLLCLGCSGGIWFQKNAIGQTASFAGTIDAKAFSSSNMSPFFTFDTLDAGLYFFIVSIDANSSGGAIWSGASQLTTSGDGASRTLDFTSASTRPYVPFSDFSVVFGQNLNFTVTADDIANPVPEPATWAMMIIGFGAIGAMARCRRALVPERG